jgi:hypothetical protein
MAPVTRKNPPHTPAAKPKPTPKPKKSKKHAPPPHQPAPPPPPRPTPAELKRYADQAVDMVLGKWPECDPGNSLNSE